MMNKPAQTCIPIHPLLAERWSPRAFDENRAIAEDSITALIEAARWTPSCYGAEPWRFVLCNKVTRPDAWQKALDCLVEGNRQWAKNAPLLVLVCADTLYAHNGESNQHCRYDTGAAAISLVMEAENQGLRCHQMAGFDQTVARTAFGVPDSFDCMAFIAIGYQADADILEINARERETAPRARRRLDESFFDGSWGRQSHD